MIGKSSFSGCVQMRKAMEGKQNLPSYYMVTKHCTHIESFIIDNTTNSIIMNDTLFNINATTNEKPNVSFIKLKPTYTTFPFLEKADIINFTCVFKKYNNKIKAVR